MARKSKIPHYKATSRFVVIPISTLSPRAYEAWYAPGVDNIMTEDSTRMYTVGQNMNNVKQSVSAHTYNRQRSSAIRTATCSSLRGRTVPSDVERVRYSRRARTD